jgi:hypothetical protein
MTTASLVRRLHKPVLAAGDARIFEMSDAQNTGVDQERDRDDEAVRLARVPKSARTSHFATDGRSSSSAS